MKLHNTMLVLVTVCAFTSCTSLGPNAANTHQLNSEVSPDEAFSMLKSGNQRFVSGHPARPDKQAERRETLAKGQKPFAIILGCADSRTAPEVIFDQQLGSLFVCRVAGIVTDPVVLGSIEYAVDHLHSPLIVVLGHSKCGAVSAALGGGHAEGNVGSLLHHVRPGTGLPADEGARLDAAVANNTSYQMKSLTAESPLIRKMVKAGKVRVVSGVYSLDTGKVTW